MSLMWIKRLHAAVVNGGVENRRGDKKQHSLLRKFQCKEFYICACVLGQGHKVRWKDWPLAGWHAAANGSERAQLSGWLLWIKIASLLFFLLGDGREWVRESIKKAAEAACGCSFGIWPRTLLLLEHSHHQSRQNACVAIKSSHRIYLTARRGGLK